MSVQTLKVTRVWETRLAEDPDSYPNLAAMRWMELDPEATEADAIAELAGRGCYQSWGKPNPATATTRGYTAHVLDVEHYSLFAHASVGYYIEGVSRSLTHELIRHRWVSFSQLSQRYVKLGDDLPYVVPPMFRSNGDAKVVLARAAQRALDDYNELVEIGAEAYPDAKPKQLRQAARAVLPNMTETKLSMTANLRAFRDMFAQRLPPTADEEIRELAQVLLADLKLYAPDSFQDIEP